MPAFSDPERRLPIRPEARRSRTLWPISAQEASPPQLDFTSPTMNWPCSTARAAAQLRGCPRAAAPPSRNCSRAARARRIAGATMSSLGWRAEAYGQYLPRGMRASGP